TTIDPYILGYWLGQNNNGSRIHLSQKYKTMIPKNYLINSRQNRLKLLAGFIDSNFTESQNYDFCFLFGSKILAHEFCYLVRSLGYQAILSKTQIYWKIGIFGHDFKAIPLLLKSYPISIKSKLLDRSFEI